jgi:isopentenyl phosphate kinase
LIPIIFHGDGSFGHEFSIVLPNRIEY